MQGMHDTHMPPTKFPSNIQFASEPMSSGQAALLANINPALARTDDNMRTYCDTPAHYISDLNKGFKEQSKASEQ